MNTVLGAEPTSMAALTILIVDDHPLFAAGFAHMTRALRPNWTLHTACSASEAMDMLDGQTPDLAICDVGLPDIDGFALLHAITANRPKLRVVLISGRNDPAVRVRARACGAAGFIAKTEPPEAIVAMIDSILAGAQVFGEAAPAEMPVLTARQAEVLALLAEGHANKEIRHRLGIAERTVRAHLTELFQLLGASSRMQAVIRGRELGLIAK